MSGYETDFITGRAINSDDKAVAVVIMPTLLGYPNPVRFPAKAPVYPSDRFEPLSLLLKGGLDEQGYFAPDEGQVSLVIFEGLVGMPWKRFRKEVLNKDEHAIRLAGEIFTQPMAPGLAIMHASTLDSLIAIAKAETETSADAKIAAEITMDAKRLVDSGEDRYWMISEMAYNHEGQTYITQSGVELRAPKVSSALIEMENSLLSVPARQAIRKYVRRAEDTDGSELIAVYENLADFQKLNYGMRMMNRYFQPSAFTNGDNLVITTKFNLKEIQESLTGFSDRAGFEEENERFDEHLESMAQSLRDTLKTVEGELERRAAFNARMMGA